MNLGMLRELLHTPLDNLTFSRRIASAGLTEVLTAPASPWQNAYAERVIGSIRRECLDNTIILGQQHLRRTVKRYADYYNGVRTHREGDSFSLQAAARSVHAGTAVACTMNTTGRPLRMSL